jgi:heme/copper-type cytochrome/quinol oxidase subunit 2
MGCCEGSETAGSAEKEHLKTMWIFITLATLGVAFMLYALLQFFRESKRTISAYRQGSNPKVPGTQSARPVIMISQSSRQRSPLQDARRRMELR